MPGKLSDMSKSDAKSPSLRPATAIVRAGRDKSITGPFVNPPVVHASTVLYDSVDDMVHRRQRYAYGRRGTPTIEALAKAVSELDGAAGTVLCPSGLSAISTALLASLSSGDHLLMVDCVYAPARHFAKTILRRLGIETTFFDPNIGAGIGSLFTERTRAVYMEAPGSLTFEMQDVPAIVAAARDREITTIFDNTWATSYYFKPLAIGVDITLVAATKYIGGHSDVMLGTVSANEALWPKLLETHGSLGLCVGPDDIYLGLRGLRTMAVRLERQMRSGLAIARWLEARPEVTRVLHPGLESDPGHAIWKRDMAGASGLFGVHLAGWTKDDAARFVDGLQFFGIGASWGGYESLAILANPGPNREAAPWTEKGAVIRLHIGLEDPDDLIADLEAGFARVAGAA
jgi:cystathionine beta-lyase